MCTALCEALKSTFQPANPAVSDYLVNHYQQRWACTACEGGKETALAAQKPGEWAVLQAILEAKTRSNPIPVHRNAPAIAHQQQVSGA